MTPIVTERRDVVERDPGDLWITAFEVALCIELPGIVETMAVSRSGRSVPKRDAGTQGRSWASSPGVRRGMQANRGRDTAPELAVRRLVHAAGLRYRVDSRPIATLNRRADLVFTRAKVAVFVDGCFWHGCAEHHTVARTNAAFWAEKVRRNRERDRETDRLLGEAGWTVVRCWEHEDPEDVADVVIGAVRGRGKPTGRRTGPLG